MTEVAVVEGATQQLERISTDLDNLARMGTWMAIASTGGTDPKTIGAANALKMAFANSMGFPLTAAAEIHLIKGQFVLSAKLCRALGPSHGVRVVPVEETADSCTAAVIDIKTGRELGRRTYTLAQAVRQGLDKPTRSGRESNWTINPDRMLWARASKQVLDDFAPWVTVGIMSYEEHDEFAVLEPDEVIDPADDVPFGEGGMTSTAPERAASYHADNEGRLSSTIARNLILKTPAHAKAILDGRVTFESDAMTVGTAVHQLLLRDDRVDVIEADSFRTNDAKEQRDMSREAGRVPILRAKFDEAREIAQTVNGHIVESGARPTPFTKGTAEQVLRFDLGGAACRAMLDWVRDDHTFVDDLKTTSDASPAKFRRHIFNMGYDIQAAFYTRAVEAAHGVRPQFRWVVVETRPPYPVCMFTLSVRAMEAAFVKVDAAVQLWQECVASGQWPGYPDQICEVDIPGWLMDQAEGYADDIDLLEVPF